MTRPTLFEIVYDNPAGVYNSGQVIKGTVNLNLPEELKIRSVKITLTGMAKTHWTRVVSTGQNTIVIPYYGNESYFKEEFFLEEVSQDGKTMAAGTHSYPFQMKLPDALPSSFESYHGKVRYFAECCIDRPWAINYTSKKAFSVISVFDLNTLIGVTGRFENEGHTTLCCLCCKSGPIEGILRIKQKAFVPGEKITIDAEITNRSNRTISKTELRLVQVITFYTSSKGCSKTVKKTIRRLQRPQIPPRGSDNWINESIVIPPLPPSGLKGCSIIDINYRLELIVDPSGPSLDLSVPLEIIIGNVPLRETFDSFNQLALRANPSRLPPLQIDSSGMAPLDIPGQQTPVNASNAPLVPNAPPPMYYSSVFGTSKLNDKDDKDDKDSGEAMGQLEFAPVYLTYHYDNTAFDPAVER